MKVDVGERNNNAAIYDLRNAHEIDGKMVIIAKVVATEEGKKNIEEYIRKKGVWLQWTTHEGTERINNPDNKDKHSFTAEIKTEAEEGTVEQRVDRIYKEIKDLDEVEVDGMNTSTIVFGKEAKEIRREVITR